MDYVKMKFLGLNYTKIHIEKLKNIVDDLKINANINISDIQKSSSNILKSKDDILTVKFNYSVSYDPEFANIELQGNLIISIDFKSAKNILKEWESKKIPEEFRESIFNIIFKKSNVKALQLEDEMNLPLHVPLPSIKKQENPSQEQTSETN